MTVMYRCIQKKKNVKLETLHAISECMIHNTISFKRSCGSKVDLHFPKFQKENIYFLGCF